LSVADVISQYDRFKAECEAVITSQGKRVYRPDELEREFPWIRNIAVHPEYRKLVEILRFMDTLEQVLNLQLPSDVLRLAQQKGGKPLVPYDRKATLIELLLGIKTPGSYQGFNFSKPDSSYGSRLASVPIIQVELQGSRVKVTPVDRSVLASSLSWMDGFFE